MNIRSMTDTKLKLKIDLNDKEVMSQKSQDKRCLEVNNGSEDYKKTKIFQVIDKDLDCFQSD